MSRPTRTPPSEAHSSRHKPKQEEAESKEALGGSESGSAPPMRHLAMGSASASHGPSQPGARIISGIRERAAASGSGVEAENSSASVGPAPTPEAPAVKDPASFEELVGGLVDTTVAEAGASGSKTVRAMAARLGKAVEALRAKLPKVPSELDRAVAELLHYRESVAREASEVARLGVSDLVATVRFGTEITFSAPPLHGLFVDPDEKCDKKALRNSEAAADKYLEGWAVLVDRKFSNAKDSKVAVTAAVPLSRPAARRFTFSGQDWDDDGQPVPLSWWYQTNVDNCCLELQMAPTTLGEFRDGLIGRWAQSIFEVAGDLGLKTGADSKGGGHLSMDRASSFGDSAILFSRMVQLYNNMARAGGIHRNYADDDAPFMREMDRKGGGKLAGEYDTLMKKVEESMLDPSAVLSVKEVRDQLWTLLNRAKPYREKLNNHGRYTALNIEPVTDAEPAKQRVEFRRFQGQTGIDELCAQLRELLALVDTARQG